MRKMARLAIFPNFFRFAPETSHNPDVKLNPICQFSTPQGEIKRIYKSRLLSKKMSEGKVLLGMHSPRDLGLYQSTFQSFGFEITSVESLEEMDEIIDRQNFNWYIMDANLGDSDSYDISSSRKIFSKVEEKVKCGEANFYATSYNQGVIDNCSREEIPALGKIELTEFLWGNL
jgi:hypothetical protein